MTSPQDRIAGAVRFGQQTVNSTVRTWSDGMQKLVSNIDLKSTVPALDELVDRSYAFGVQMLARQRDLAKSLLAHAAPLTETLSHAPRQAERFVIKTERTAAKRAEEAAAKAEDIAAEAGRAATKAQHSASARGGRASAARK
jgi:ABC-type transporter Mla subunit MlaD